MNRLLLGVAAAILGIASQAHAQLQVIPGEFQPDPATKYQLIGVQKTETGVISGAVESVDAANRALVVKGTSGTRYGVRAGKSVQNFDQIHVDDTVSADYYRRATFWVSKPSDKVKPQVTDAMVTGAGRKTIVDAEQVTVTGQATVQSVDPATNVVTFKGSEGRVVPVKVKNPAIVAGLAPGQVVDYELVDASAAEVQVFAKPAPPPPPPVEHRRAKLVAKTIEITESVYFKTNESVIETKSYPLLDDVAAVMNENPNIGKFRIEGNTSKDPDSVKKGKAGYDFNMKLSQARADAVKKYLVDKGVAASRVETIGYGWNRPIVPNGSAAERAKNRRVDFVVVQ